MNQTLAREFWPGQNAVGRRLRVGKDTLDVVGVVRDGKYNNVWETPSGMVFRPLAQDVPALATIAVRTTRPPLEMAAAVRQAIRTADPDVAVYDVRTMADHLDNGNAFFLFRLGAFVTGLFGVMGVLLASIGLYGMIAYHVSQRTQEIGVRMALGAQASDIIRDVLVRGGRLALIGIAIGVVLAGALAQMLRTLLVDVSPFDPLTYGAVAFLLLTVSLLASFVPARRATVVDPLVALRADFLFSLPEREHRSSRIDKNTHRAGARHFGDVAHDPGAERFGFLRRRRDVLHVDVGQPDRRFARGQGFFRIPPPVPWPGLIIV